MSSTQYPLFLPFDYGGQNKSRGPGEGLFDPRRQSTYISTPNTSLANRLADLISSL
jgi:hypothetical protein